MRKSTAGLYIGLALVAAGVLYILDALNIISFSLFDGWWAILIFIPCIVGLIKKEGNQTVCIIGILFSACVLLHAVFSGINFFALVFAAILLGIGIKLIFPQTFSQTGKDHEADHIHRPHEGHHTESTTNTENKDRWSVSPDNTEIIYYSDGTDNAKSQNSNGTANEKSTNSKSHRAGYINETVIFGGKELRMDNEVFEGANLNAFLGGVDLNLRRAIIREDVRIEAVALMGGVEIHVPDYVRVKVNCTPIMGGVDDKSRTPAGADENTPTIFINATCIMGGIDIR